MVTDFDRANIRNIMHDKPGYDWFTCKLLRLLASSDLENREKIRTIYPEAVELFEEWRNGEIGVSD